MKTDKLLTDASHHITLNHPVRALDEADKADYDLIRLVGFQRGFESLIVAVYYDKGAGSAGDAEEAAVEYLDENFPASLTDEEREERSASWVEKLANPFQAARREALAHLDVYEEAIQSLGFEKYDGDMGYRDFHRYPQGEGKREIISLCEEKLNVVAMTKEYDSDGEPMVVELLAAPLLNATREEIASHVKAIDGALVAARAAAEQAEEEEGISA